MERTDPAKIGATGTPPHGGLPSSVFFFVDCYISRVDAHGLSLDLVNVEQRHVAAAPSRRLESYGRGRRLFISPSSSLPIVGPTDGGVGCPSASFSGGAALSTSGMREFSRCVGINVFLCVRGGYVDATDASAAAMTANTIQQPGAGFIRGDPRAVAYGGNAQGAAISMAVEPTGIDTRLQASRGGTRGGNGGGETYSAMRPLENTRGSSVRFENVASSMGAVQPTTNVRGGMMDGWNMAMGGRGEAEAARVGMANAWNNSMGSFQTSESASLGMRGDAASMSSMRCSLREMEPRSLTTFQVDRTVLFAQLEAVIAKTGRHFAL